MNRSKSISPLQPINIASQVPGHKRCSKTGHQAAASKWLLAGFQVEKFIRIKPCVRKETQIHLEMKLILSFPISSGIFSILKELQIYIFYMHLWWSLHCYRMSTEMRNFSAAAKYTTEVFLLPLAHALHVDHVSQQGHGRWLSTSTEHPEQGSVPERGPNAHSDKWPCQELHLGITHNYTISSKASPWIYLFVDAPHKNI